MRAIQKGFGRGWKFIHFPQIKAPWILPIIRLECCYFSGYHTNSVKYQEGLISLPSTKPGRKASLLIKKPGSPYLRGLDVGESRRHQPHLDHPRETFFPFWGYRATHPAF